MKQWFANLKMSAKLGIGFGLCLSLAGAIFLAGWVAIQTLHEKIQVITKDSMPSLSTISNFNIQARAVRIVTYRIAVSDQENLSKVKGLFSTYKSKADTCLEDYSKLLTNEEDKKNFEEVKKQWNRYIDEWGKVESQVAANTANLKILEGDTTRIFNEELEPAIKKMIEFNENYANRSRDAAEASIASARTKLTTALLCALAMGIASAVIITKYIAGNVRTVAAQLEALQANCVSDLEKGLGMFSHGDLTFAVSPSTKPISLDSTDEIGSMAKSFNGLLGRVQASIGSYNEARGSLTQIVAKLQTNANDVSNSSQTLASSSEQSGAAATEIARGSQSLADQSSKVAEVMESLLEQIKLVGKGSEEQLHVVEETNLSLGQAAQGIERVASAAQTMQAAANEGNASVVQTVDAMQKVKQQVQSSAAKVQELDKMGHEIGMIVGSIGQIAEQTNLLALNAAIEAARAGEHGRGFAVVAEEVRKLAEQSSHSAQEIGNLITKVKAVVDDTVSAINSTTSEVEKGSQLSDEAGRSLSHILSASQDVAEQAESVAAVAQEVSATVQTLAESAQQNMSSVQTMLVGASDVQAAIENVAAVSEESAAGAQELTASVEEVGASATELAFMGENLMALANQFKPDVQSPNLRLAA